MACGTNLLFHIYDSLAVRMGEHKNLFTEPNATESLIFTLD